MAEPPGKFAAALRALRARARLTQEELADAAGLSRRAVSDLERGVATTPQHETVRLLADALRLIGPQRSEFETVARGRPLPVAPLAAASAMRSLPHDVSSFTGRPPELDQLAKAATTGGGVVSIHAIGGMAGVGKTAFAVHAAHQLANRFPGGQVFLLLHGHTPGQAPADPADRRGQARALSQLGNGRRQLAQYPAAALALDEALGAQRDLRHPAARRTPSPCWEGCGATRVTARARCRRWRRRSVFSSRSATRPARSGRSTSAGRCTG
jgi:transcriptional regulator with XRE-family HTH domain